MKTLNECYFCKPPIKCDASMVCPTVSMEGIEEDTMTDAIRWIGIVVVPNYWIAIPPKRFML